MEKFKKIFELQFIQDLIARKGEVFIVGGTVRDHFLGKEPKDVDLIVRNIPINDLIRILGYSGKVDLVGESFSVIKFTFGGEVYDIALPRTDTKIEGSKGHKSIHAQADHNLPIETDLERRDITINSIAISQNLELIDPFNGVQDIKTQIVRATSPDSFIDDPLRMMRAVGLATRFGFNIEQNTFEMILFNNHLIKDITGERIFDEIQKVVEKKSDLNQYRYWLRESGLWAQFFGQNITRVDLSNAKTISEVLFLFGNFIMDGKDFKAKLKLENVIEDEIQILYNFNKLYSPAGFSPDTMFVFNTLKKSHIVLESKLTPHSSVEWFLNGTFPKSLKELALNGEDFMVLGLQGKEIGEAQKKCLESIFSFKVKNTKEDLLTLF